MSNGDEDIGVFEAFLEDRLGLSRSSLHLGQSFAEVLHDRARARGCENLLAYWHALRDSETTREELRALAPLLTVGETYFFRESRQIDALIEVAMPERLASRGDAPVRILSAGCASGEEAYSIAIALRAAYPTLAPYRTKILGIDVNPEAIRKAQRGRYSQWTLRAVPEDIRARWFVRNGSEIELREELRGLVDFEERNLIDEVPELGRAGAFDVIFCRNVLMYLAPAKMRAVLDRFARALAPGGFLFLGSSETLRGAASAFEPAHTRDAFFYRRKATAAEETRARVSEAPWSIRIQKTAARVADAVPRRAPQGDVGAAPVGPAVRRDDSHAEHPAIARVLELIGGEHFAEAGAELRALPREAQSDARVELLRAVLLCQQGDLAEAERACSRAIAAGDRGSAYYVLGLCREQSGDAATAARQYQAAAHLDPTFAMPHLRLGLLAKRAGDLATSRIELGRAAELLMSEQHERVVLFGGGFARWALLGICQTELGAPGGHR